MPPISEAADWRLDRAASAFILPRFIPELDLSAAIFGEEQSRVIVKKVAEWVQKFD